MKPQTTFWLALFAALLAAVAIVLRLSRGSGDLFEIVGPAGIILLMLVIMSNNRRGGSHG
ncbi:hypothetical protein [uncultured Sphingomonas sp.]|uniref:hypothetical protein n=1 Tax=uncultured Sphingomonas sp. TaxID=158754 RepID=UPI0035CBDEE4